ncbi:MAG: ABC transporter permease [Candidatus Acidiferrales bacterium]
MRVLRRLIARLSNFATRRRDDERLREEIEEHLTLQTAENLRVGLAPAEASRQAMLKFGAVEAIKEEFRAERGMLFIETLLQDIRFALRMLRKSPGFAAVAVLTLAIGIGANTAMFSVVDGILLAPLAYSQPDRLVVIWENNLHFKHTVWPSYPNFQDWQRSAGSFQQVAALRWQDYDLTSPGTPEHALGENVSANFFTTLGVELALGRNFSRQEDQRGGAPVVIVSNRLWKNRLSGRAQELGKPVTLNGVDYTIVGVLPPGFRFGDDEVDVYTPLGQGDPLMLDPRGAPAILSIARLKPSVSIAQAQAEMSAIQARLEQLYPDANRGLGTDVVPLKRVMVGDVSGTLLLLLGAVGLVLLIACANIANLLLARSVARTREFAIRLALGASRKRVARQLLTESTLLSVIGAGLGLAIAKWGVAPVLAAVPGGLPRSENIGINASVLLFTLGVSIAVGIVFGLAPALKTSKIDLHTSLKEGGRGTTSAHHRVQNSFVIVQIALTLVLLVGAGLLFRTIRQMWDSNTGFDTQHVITFKVSFSPSLTKTAASMRAAYRQLLERVGAIPGVQAVDFTYIVPLVGEDNVAPFWIGSQKPALVQAAPRMMVFDTGPDYLRAMGIPLVRGRFFTQEDTTKSPCVAAIDTVFANTYFRGQDPLGQGLNFGWTPPWGPCRIVGVVGHVRQWGLGDESSFTQAQAYYPLYQIPDEWVIGSQGFPTTAILVRTSLPAAALIPAVKNVVYEIGKDQPVYDVRTMQDIATESMSSQRFPMILLEIFASLALLLASIGIYGVISYTVSQRVHEIGIRMALGAERRDVFRMIIGQGLRLAFAGLAIGIAAAAILTRLLSSFTNLLYGVRAGDPATFVGVAVMLALVALAACYIPARRAMRVEPMEALRYE